MLFVVDSSNLHLHASIFNLNNPNPSSTNKSREASFRFAFGEKSNLLKKNPKLKYGLRKILDRQGKWVSELLILPRLMAIETQQNKVMQELTEYLSKRVYRALTQLCQYLSTEDVGKRFASWALDDAPKGEMSWEATVNQIMKTLSRRLRDIIEQ